MIHLVWLFFVLLALLGALLPSPPGPWLDRAMHFFGIGSLGARGTLVLLFGLVALVGFAADVLLDRVADIATPWRLLDAAALGIGVALVLLALLSRVVGRHGPDID